MKLYRPGVAVFSVELGGITMLRSVRAPANNFGRVTLTIGVSLFALVASAAAQTSEPTASALASEVEPAAEGEIVVTASRPIAESEAAALEIQRNSDSLVTVLSSDAVGRLPDQNIAQAVGRLPGIGVQRDQGQARYINLRGAPLNWTTLSLNGINIVSPEGRDARFDSIPSAIASQVIVNKAVTPDMSGETISGNVDVITRTGLDQKGFRFSGKLGYGVGDLGNKDEVEAYALIANQFETGIGDIGILVSGSYYARGIATDNVETDWEQVPQDTRPGAADRFWARETERKFYRATRRNYSATGRLDWRPDSDNRVFVESIYTAFTDAEQRDNYIFDFDDQQTSAATVAALAAPCPATAPTQPPAGTTGYADVCLNTPFKGTVSGIDINTNLLIRRFVQSIFTNTIGGDHKFGDGWSVKWRGNYSRSLDDRSAPVQFNFDSPNFANATQRPTVRYDLTDHNATTVALFNTTRTGTQLAAGPAVANIQSFALPLTRVRSTTANDTTEAYTGRLEIGKAAEIFGGDASIRVGFQFDERTKESIEASIDRSSSADLAAANAAGIPNTILPYVTAGSYIGKIAPGYDFQYFDVGNLFAQGNILNGLFAKAPVTNNFYKVTERVLTGYAIFQSKFDWGSVIGGVRYENVRNVGNAFSSVTTVTNPTTTPPTTVTANIPISSETSRSLFFPSLHLNVNLDDTKKLRFGLTSGAARPDYDQLRPNLTVNDANLSISGGNPAAKPERAYGVDAYFEWYVRPQGLLSVGVFYKRVEDVLFNTRRTFGSDALNFGGVDRSQYSFGGLVNGGSGYLYGAEAAVQLQLEPYTSDLGLPEWMGGFGISANATLNRSRVDKPAVFNAAGAIIRPLRQTKLPGTSDTVYNVGVYYEKYGVSLRAQYQRRSDWLDSVADTLVDGGDAYWLADDELDVSARVEIRPGVEIYADASNLLNGPGTRYVSDRRYTIELEKFGRRFTGGVRLTF